MTKEQFEELSEKDQIGFIVSYYDNKLTLEQSTAIAKFVYDLDLLKYCIDDDIFARDDDEIKLSYEDSIDLVRHWDNRRF
jgi:hypothetical protein